MNCVFTFLEGLATFVSPCLLPMLPVYVTYFAGGTASDKRKTFWNALGFCLGFTVVFVALGALAGSVGGLLMRYQRWVNIITGIIVIIFGLNFLGVFQWKLFHGGVKSAPKGKTFLSSVLFGIVFSVGWTPCVGAFLGAAMMKAAQSATVWSGVLLLLCYSAGLAIPFIISAMLLDKLRGVFTWVKAHYDIINRVCGILLILLGILMMTGQLQRLSTMLSF